MFLVVEHYVSHFEQRMNVNLIPKSCHSANCTQPCFHRGSCQSMITTPYIAAITCEQNIPGIKKLLPSQPPEANKEFSFTCNAGYVKNNDIVSVRCLPSGSWSVGSNSLCSCKFLSQDIRNQQRTERLPFFKATSETGWTHTCRSRPIPYVDTVSLFSYCLKDVNVPNQVIRC